MKKEELKKLEEEFATDELEDFELDTDAEIRYEVWVVFWEKFEVVDTGISKLIDDFGDETEARKCANFFSEIKNLELLKNKYSDFEIPENNNISIEIVRVVGADEEIIYEKNIKKYINSLQNFINAL